MRGSGRPSSVSAAFRDPAGRHVAFSAARRARCPPIQDATTVAGPGQSSLVSAHRDSTALPVAAMSAHSRRDIRSPTARTRDRAPGTRQDSRWPRCPPIQDAHPQPDRPTARPREPAPGTRRRSRWRRCPPIQRRHIRSRTARQPGLVSPRRGLDRTPGGRDVRLFKTRPPPRIAGQPGLVRARAGDSTGLPVRRSARVSRLESAHIVATEPGLVKGRRGLDGTPGPTVRSDVAS